MSTADHVWRAVHVHRYERQDEFLVRAVAPLVTSLRESDAISRFFFLRYWQGGHHLRLRFRAAPDLVDAVSGEVAAKLGAHLAESPAGHDFDVDGFATAQPTMAALEGVPSEPIQPPDTIRPSEYEPEYAKYGGPRGVAIAEDFFDRSSDIALDCLTGVADRSSRRLGAAFTSMVRGLRAAGCTPTAMADFCAHYCLQWSPYVFDQFLDTWPRLVDERGPAVRAHMDRIMSGGPLTDPFSTAVRRAWSSVDAVLPDVSLIGQDAPPERRRQVLLVSYLHTHNNRLGLIPEQEAFLGYLGHHVLGRGDLLPHVVAARDRRVRPDAGKDAAWT
jgi:thiopeptide-type bacteriocin biosynthesis protein